MNDLNEEDFWRELFVVKMRREERMIAALQANPDPKTSMQRPMTRAASEASPPSMPEEEKRKDTFNRSFSGKIEDLGQRSNAERRLIEVMDSGMLDVTIASLEDPGSYSPSAEIWAEDKLPWVVLNPELPKYPQATN
jgi:hypothetical protein